MERKLLLTRGGGKSWERGEPVRSKKAPAFNTQQYDKEIPILSQYEEKSESSSSSTSSSPDEEGINTSNPNPMRKKLPMLRLMWLR